jgi:hypothetical protein
MHAEPGLGFAVIADKNAGVRRDAARPWRPSSTVFVFGAVPSSNTKMSSWLER